MTAQFNSVSNLASLYLVTLVQGFSGVNTITLRPLQARDSNNLVDINSSAFIGITRTVSGANGLDTGTIAASTWYYVFVLGDSRGFRAAAGLISTSTTPVMPAGYDSYRLVGFALTDGSANFIPFNTQESVGSSSIKSYWWPQMPVVSAALTANTLTTISVAAGVPSFGNFNVYFWASFTPNAPGDVASFRMPGDSVTTNLFTIVGNVAGQPTTQQFKFLTRAPLGVPSIDYKVSAGSLALSVQGFEAFL